MKNHPVGCCFLSFALCVLLVNQGCATALLLDTVDHTTEVRNNFNAVQSAYLTPDQRLILCVGNFDGQTSGQVSVEIDLEQLQNRPPASARTWVVPNNAIRSSCPTPSQSWRNLAVVDRTTLPADLRVSPRLLDQLPLEPGTDGTLFELPARDMVAFASREPMPDGNYAAAFQVQGSRQEQTLSGGEALVLLPLALAFDAVTLPLQVLLVVGFGPLCASGGC